ncbi:MAG: LysR family transcriptional regulator [Polyangiales bacterium]
MQLTHLHYLQAIAKHGSLSAAARALSLSQPALTAAIQSLERELGTTLLYRGRNGATLTDAGALVLRHTADLFAEVERMTDAVRGLSRSDEGSFTLGCHESLGAYFLPGFMAAFLRDSPGIRLSLWNASSAAVRDAVIQREVHFGLAVNPLPHPDLVMIRLFHDAMDFMVLAAQSLPATRPRDEALAFLAGRPLIHAARVSQARELVERVSQEIELAPRLLACGDLELVKSLTLAGIGVGVLPRRVAAYGHEGKLQRLHPDLPFVPDTIQLLFRADLLRTRAVTHLKEALCAWGRSLDEA